MATFLEAISALQEKKIIQRSNQKKIILFNNTAFQIWNDYDFEKVKDWNGFPFEDVIANDWLILEKYPELKRCVFCKSINSSIKQISEEKHYVSCSDCGAQGPVKETPMKAKEAWGLFFENNYCLK